ncbi:hypothetical protein L6452_11896 [Arctium lappa]|uniref:Uncharacterized protein n=1 Tax=Arctium lappa TaxID=4217 RepID=A0ACB9DQB0_ARCLA|nr:hypothetical protein L6452_11896 [Arctium lappa]
MGHTSLGVSSVVSPMGSLQWCLHGLDGDVVAGKSMVQIRSFSSGIILERNQRAQQIHVTRSDVTAIFMVFKDSVKKQIESDMELLHLFHHALQVHIIKGRDEVVDVEFADQYIQKTMK